MTFKIISCWNPSRNLNTGEFAVYVLEKIKFQRHCGLSGILPLRWKRFRTSRNDRNGGMCEFISHLTK